MQKDRYMNAMLTLIAVLLAGLLFTQVSERPLVDSAQAQIRSGTARTGVVTKTPHVDEGVSSIGQRAWDQRQELIVELAVMGRMLGELSDYVRSGQMQVRLDDPDKSDDAQRSRRGTREH